ncbi:FAD-dependent oxidoreductase [Thermorudis peleae]|uniref:FAD-dependent oxidoreductase n=1 Tax=Thermorudis peleae TaxID=1382356 RepID=UPI0030D0DB5A
MDLRLGEVVCEIDATAQRVVVERSQGQVYTEPYDQLVIATGARPRTLALPGQDAAGVFTLTTIPDALAIRTWIEHERPRHAVVVGGGYIGLEATESLVVRGISTTLIEQAPQIMNTLDPEMAHLVAEAIEKSGVELRLQDRITQLHIQQGRIQSISVGDDVLPADLLIFAPGIEPNSDLAREAGIALGVANAIHVDETLHTSAPNVWAAGDCAETFHLVTRRPAWIPLGTTANKQGRICGQNVAGNAYRFPGVVGTAITKFLDLEIARTGLNEREAQQAGITYATATIRSTTRSGYYPGSAPITVKLLAERGSGRLLGGQIVGGVGAGKRIDTLAVALHADLDVEAFQWFDLAYAPPFSPVWDPVLIAARQLARTI